MTQIEKQVNEIHTMVSIISKSVGDHDDTLYGDKGIKDRVIVLETNQSSNKNSIAMAISIITAVVAVGTLIATVVI